MIFKALSNLFIAVIVGSFIQAATKGDLSLLLRILIIASAGLLFFGFMGLLQVAIATDFVRDVNVGIKQTMLNTIIFYRSIEGTGKSLSFMTNDLKQLETNGISAGLELIQQGITFLIALAGCMYFDFWTSVVFIAGSLMPILISRLTKTGISQASTNWSKQNARYTNTLKDDFSGMETIRTYQAEDEIIHRSCHRAALLENALKIMNRRVGNATQYTTTAAYLLSVFLPFSFGIYRVISGTITLGVFMTITQLSNYLTNPIIQISTLRNQISTTKEIQKRIRAAETINQKNSMGKISGKLPLPKFQSIALENATIRRQNNTIFQGLNFEVKRGDKILIMAPSGFGKTTLLRTLQNQILLEKGDYLYNGYPVSEFDKHAIAHLFSFIKQNPFLLSDTIRFNITLGQGYTDQEVMEAAEHAGLAELIREKGLDFQIGANGGNLSGGQLQRIEIARALIRKRPILLADELTSALDNQLSLQIHRTLFSLPITIIEAGHKLSQEEMQNYDHVIHLDTLENSSVVM